MESWRAGELETWRAGDLEIWKAGELEISRVGDLETLRGFFCQDSSARSPQQGFLARIPQPGIYNKRCLGSPLASFSHFDIFVQACLGQERFGDDPEALGFVHS